MNFHKLLEKQIKKYLTEECLRNKHFLPFIMAVNNSYDAYERDQVLSAHASRLSEEEYIAINHRLKEEIVLKEKGLRNLREVIKGLGDLPEPPEADDKDDLIGALVYLHRHIEQRKKLETELRRLSLVASMNENGVIFTDPDGVIFWANEGFARLTGYSMEEIVGKTPIELCKGPLSDRDTLRGMMDAFMTGKSFGVEVIHYRKDNSWFWGKAKGQSIVDEKGEITQYFAMVEDVTHEKEQEEQLRVLSQIAADNINGVVIADAKGNIEWVNKSFMTTSGYTLEEIKGRRPGQVLQGPETDPATVAYLKQQVEAGEPFSCEVLNYTKQGHKYWLRLQGQAIRSKKGEVISFFALEEDITDKKNAELSLQKNEEKYRGIISNMNLGLLEVDLDGRIQFANQSFCDLSGYSFEELQGHDAAGLFMKEDDLTLMAAKAELRLKGISDAYEIRACNRKGENRWWLVSGAPRYDDLGRVIGSIGIHLDITEQKHLQLELIEAREQAEGSSRSKEAFLANMSHEIRTPMNAILGMSRQLQKTALDKTQQLYLDTIHSAAENLLVVINDILDISKIEAGKLAIEHIGFQLQDVLTKATRVMLHRAEEKGLRLTVSVDDNIPAVLIGDPFRLNQIVLNLVSNAIKFTEKGSVGIQCLKNGQQQDRQMVCIRVADTGIGMDTAFLQDLFQKFHQEDHSGARKYGGTGLGMSISKQLVELMDGKIEVQSVKGQGTVVTLCIPFATGKETDLPLKEETVADATVLKGKRILLVEDNEMNRMVATLVLNNYGAIVSEVVNGEEAVAAVKASNYDLVLMDVQMPVMDGLEATRLIRGQVANRMPIIALTANAIKGENNRCLAAGMNDYISKPFEEEELVRMIARWLGKELCPVNTSNQPGRQKPLYSLCKLQQIGRGDQEFIKKMMGIFLRDVPATVQAIRKAYADQDFKTLYACAHRIKPVLGNLCIDSLREAIREIEEKALQNLPSPQLDALITQLEDVIGCVAAEVRITG